MNVLAIDVGGTHGKVLVSDRRKPREFRSGHTLSPAQMVKQVRRFTTEDAIAFIGGFRLWSKM